MCCTVTAFDKVSLSRLISKLYSYGINKTVVKWIQDFLSGRRFRVQVNLSYSLWNLLTGGIPQSSVLNPILFFSQPSIYIDGWLYAMSMTSVVCNVPVLSQNDWTYHHSVFTT